MTERNPVDPRAYPDRPFVGVGAVIFRGDEVLIAQRGKLPRRDTWSIPGGAQEVGETYVEAAIREIMTKGCDLLMMWSTRSAAMGTAAWSIITRWSMSSRNGVAAMPSPAMISPR